MIVKTLYSVQWPCHRECRQIVVFGIFYIDVLALLDYVSRAHQIEIRPSAVHPSVWQSSLYLIREFLSHFSWRFPWATNADIIYFLFKKKPTHFPFFFTILFFVFVNMGPNGTKKISKYYSYYKSQLTVFKFSWIFLPSPLTKLVHWGLEILSSPFLTFFF